MVCSNCGMNNRSGFKFCVKCGSRLEAPNEMNYEQVDMGNYHSEDEYSENNSGFTMDAGTFVIKDTSPQSAENSLYSSDELNDSDEEFDFSIYDEPAASSLEPPAFVQEKVPQMKIYKDFWSFFNDGNNNPRFTANDEDFFKKKISKPRFQSDDSISGINIVQNQPALEEQESDEITKDTQSFDSIFNTLDLL